MGLSTSRHVLWENSDWWGIRVQDGHVRTTRQHEGAARLRVDGQRIGRHSDGYRVQQCTIPGIKHTHRSRSNRDATQIVCLSQRRDENTALALIDGQGTWPWWERHTVDKATCLRVHDTELAAAAGAGRHKEASRLRIHSKARTEWTAESA